MTLSTFQKLLSELLAQYNEEAENHYIQNIDLKPTRLTDLSLNNGVPLFYTIEIKVESK